MRSAEFASFFLVTLGFLIAVGLTFLRHPQWVPTQFLDYRPGPDLPAPNLLLRILAFLVAVPPIVWMLGSNVWSTLSIWWAVITVALEIWWLWLVISPLPCPNCGRATEPYRAFGRDGNNLRELSYRYVCRLCKLVSRLTVWQYRDRGD